MSKTHNLKSAQQLKTDLEVDGLATPSIKTFVQSEIFEAMMVLAFFAGVFSTVFVVFLGFWAQTRMKYLETERQQLREEIKKELEMEEQKKEVTT